MTTRKSLVIVGGVPQELPAGDLLAAASVGLSNVDNTADAAKPVSTAQQTALDLKANLASPTFTGTVSGVTASMVGLGNVDNTSNATERAAAATLTNKTFTLGANSFSGTMAQFNTACTDGSFACQGQAASFAALSGASITNSGGALGSNAINAKNHFTQYNAGNAGIGAGWIAAAFGDNLGSRVVIGQYGGVGVLAAHNGDLADWADLRLAAQNIIFLRADLAERGRWSASGFEVVGTTSSSGFIAGSIEGMRIYHDSAFVSFYNSANTVRSGYVQISSATPAVFATEVDQDIIFIRNSVEMVRLISGEIHLSYSLRIEKVNAGIELGSPTSSNTPYVDFHSSGNANDFDARLISVGGSATDGQGTLNCVGNFSVNGHISLATAGNGLAIKEGSNARLGVATLVAGTVTVSNTSVTTNTRIFISIDGIGTLANLGTPYEDSASRSAGTSFTIKSSNVLDTSTISWLLVEPA